jgi:hypothetical protein
MKRTVFVFYNGRTWIKTDFEKLKKGQLFKMFEANNKPVIDKHKKDRWVVADCPHCSFNDGVYTVNVFPYIRLVK